jgi:hypothetical protein
MSMGKRVEYVEMLTALNKSILKWRKIVEGRGKDEGRANCPLCKLYHTSQTPIPCGGCPVAHDTGRQFCQDTPYEHWSDHQNNHDFPNGQIKCDECEELAKKEEKYLADLWEQIVEEGRYVGE